MIHALKTHPGPFAEVKAGRKPYEIRKADRPFKVGDVLWLQEWKPCDGCSRPNGACGKVLCAGGEYTGSDLKREISYMTRPGEWGLPEDLCVLGLAMPPAAIR